MLQMRWKFPAIPFLSRESLGAYSPLVVTAMVAAALAYTSARLTWMAIPAPRQEMAPPAASSSPVEQTVAVDALRMAQEIGGRHLFGAAAADSSGSQAIPETRLNLTLRGAISSPSPSSSWAIIAEPGGKENFYAVGAQLPGGAILKEVQPRQVVLTRNGRPETLSLPEDPPLPLTAPPTSSLPAAAAAPNQALREYRDAFMRDPQSLTGLLQGEPVREGGRIVGYRLQAGRNAGVLAQFGLQPGDVITSVNGMNLGDPGGRTKLMRELPNMSQVSLDVLRDGVPQSFSFDLE